MSGRHIRQGASLDLGTATFEAPVTDVHIRMANGATVHFKHAKMTFGARTPGKSVAALVGQPLLPFHEWKSRKQRLDAPLLRPKSDYHALYGRYVANHRLANPSAAPIQDPPATVDPSKHKGTE